MSTMKYISILFILLVVPSWSFCQGGYVSRSQLISENTPQGWTRHQSSTDGSLWLFNHQGNVIHIKHYLHFKKKTGYIFSTIWNQYVVEVDCGNMLYRVISGRKYDKGSVRDMLSYTYYGYVRRFPDQWQVADHGSTIGAEVEHFCSNGHSGVHRSFESLRNNGSGVFIRADGLIATNFHVINGFSEYAVFVNGALYKANLIGSDQSNDLAILKIDDPQFVAMNHLPYVLQGELKLGESIFAMGYPLTDYMGENIKVSDGIINSLSGFQDNLTQIQVSIPLQPGNSGSPIFSKKGVLQGIVTSGLNRTITENVSYGVKVSYLLLLCEHLNIDITDEKLRPSQEFVGMIEEYKNYVCIIKAK